MMRAPCFQHDSYDSECSSCRELNGQEACAVGMCFFLAEKGSQYCRHHRAIEEASDMKRQRLQAERKMRYERRLDCEQPDNMEEE